MAKISPASIKYNITADFESEGPLEKPDVIGAIFGQTEGLLGSDMELRELQQEGKIGRIDVELTREGGKTKGEIIIPSALDKTETTIIAAALETIDKVGPTEAKITITGIEDVRGSKRDYIMERAKQLLASVKGTDLESQEMGQELKDSSRTSKITSYGEEELPAGDLSGEEIIVVEGRADVVNMLKHNLKNVIGMNGTKLPKEIAKLGETKELTLFVDGDRGGNLIAQNVCDNARVKYIAQAPDGKEVEELSGKDLQIALRRKVKVDEFFSRQRGPRRSSRFSSSEEKKEFKISEKKLSSEDKKKLVELSKNLKGSAIILGESLGIIKQVSSSRLKNTRLDSQPFVVLVEKVTPGTIEGCEILGVKYLVAKTFGKIVDTKVELVSI
jgi:DNA primase